ncbi:ARM repeat-containing protein, partial [Cadophora sp. DSE1049]
TGPLNYWHLLSRPVDCNWHSIVRKVIYDNDRQSSTFLQKLIAGSAKTHDIVDAVITLAYPLMIHSDGNFLVQCCFEYGSLGQIIKMAKVVGENILNLAMDAFGCHVVQKAVDNVPENYKVAMANRLLPHIHDTIIHPYASHVWKKLLTVRWEIPRPHIIEYLNKGLCGMWHKIALNRSGSVLVQTIFENCVEEDKRPCIEELFVNIDIVSHGQFGSWCIEHICEHGTVADRRRAIDHIIRHAVEYSTDRFASKVVRHCLVIGGAEFLNRYVDTVCQNHSAGFRIPLIDIAINQYGSSLIQWILTHSSPVHRELIARHVRKYKVSLHGSRFGTPVSMLCADALASTYPVTGTLARRTRNPRYSVI